MLHMVDMSNMMLCYWRWHDTCKSNKHKYHKDRYHQNKYIKTTEITLPNTFGCPRAVMIVPFDTDIAWAAMVASFFYHNVADLHLRRGSTLHSLFFSGTNVSSSSSSRTFSSVTMPGLLKATDKYAAHVPTQMRTVAKHSH